MRYEHPLPAGMNEPDDNSVKVKALETLVRAIVVGWPDDRLKAEAEYQASLRFSGGAPLDEEDVLTRRSAEAASQILWDVWLSKMAASERQAMRDGTHPMSIPEADDV